MAGTNRKREATQKSQDGPVVILMQPQLGENIGFAVRAMRNFGLGDLRLVRPRDGWPTTRRPAPTGCHYRSKSI